ncbi:MAG: hypothetical protein WC371_01300 [Parachlamydiales bacterium]|jgi:hypothetical protein
MLSFAVFFLCCAFRILGGELFFDYYQIEKLEAETIILNDHSVWQTSLEDALELKNFQTGDRIIITANSSWYDWWAYPEYAFRLINQRTQSSINLKNRLGPMIDNPFSRYVVALDQNRITLSENLAFQLQTEDASFYQAWAAGDLIFIGKNAEKLTSFPWLLINFSTNSAVRAQSAR